MRGFRFSPWARFGRFPGPHSGLGAAPPTLSLNFETGTLDSRITFSRSTTAMFVGSNGLIQSAAINAPRFGFDPVTLAPLGLLIEEQRVNLALYSDQFDNAAWGKALTTITANATTSPDGTANADKITPTAVAGEHYARQTISISTGASITVSIYVKADGYRSIRMRCLDAAIPANGFQGSLDTSTGSHGGSVAGAGTFTSASATSVGNGWWRLTVTGSAGASAASIIFDVFVLPGDQNSASSFTGDGVSGLFLWGAQLEVGTFATSYIPTVASTVTRTADIATMTGANFSSWYNQSEGTMVASWSTTNAVTSTILGIFSATDGTANERIQIRRVAASNSTGFIAVDGGVTQYVDQITASSGINMSAIAYKLNDFIGANNGTLGVADITGTLPAPTQADIGFAQGQTYLNGHIRFITYYATRLTNAQLQAVTA